MYLNRGVRSIFFALKPDSSTSFPIDQLTHVLQTEREKTLIKIEFDQERITAALRNTPNLMDRVSKNYNFYRETIIVIGLLTHFRPCIGEMVC